MICLSYAETHPRPPYGQKSILNVDIRMHGLELAGNLWCLKHRNKCQECVRGKLEIGLIALGHTSLWYGIPRDHDWKKKTKKKTDRKFKRRNSTEAIIWKEKKHV